MKFKLSLLALLCSASSVMAESAPKNIIYMIGDGMGPAYTTAYRYFKDDPNTKVVDPTVFDTILRGMAHTYPDDHTYVTDSAAGATALSSGRKSYNGAIAVDTDKKPVKTMLEIAKERGMTTALVATSQINHATPASFAAHNESRRNYDEIANDYIDNKIAGKLPVDLMLGGGTKYYVRDDRNLVEEFKSAGYQYSDDFAALNEIKQIPALGLFAEVGLPFALDENPTRLTQMTSKALDLLDGQNDKGFFVMIEGSQIDWCGHANDIACAMGEMDDFAKSIEQAKAYVDKNPDTLLVITADHSTGGLTLGAHGQYKWETEVVKGVKATAGTITDELQKTDDLKSVWQRYTNIEFTEENSIKLEQAKKMGDKALLLAVKDIINHASFTGWTTGGHTAIDVQVFAYGQRAKDFYGSQNNTDIADKLIDFIKQ
ncbi:alkaline phosphatase [Pseudoalteromonas lipolytica SCSIO 04301]|jgi:alkaline phosphatase|uniref:Alkaline phosphatase n=2 Tax=Pseudoalteromonas lipolytica TaxID=570156 RepID=A0ABY1GM80_9GAMM|nr:MULTISPECIES: alkaline phosphatase [Pseudoalteromonas]EWH05144.1 alkaline phosphatase [Pseudoalteromonas lipolytica SCSIO 04301]MBE0353139.1 alkaline phosphatase [Pseudoalteromonas lipolytica LMEB 39]MCC9661954.1 alkaline phosphatase [Pseudoalteromonas sp. MB41]QMW16419.1 alkaline phosphatase [Pseudoalteromonas sp. MT33b]SFT72244.1 alkaline phosphatase [Pseudoalteromonas lipolytica]|tara:strand:- start:100 stop:1389 length:1290 start_codon:yes stop_codon:yes gene_type:complete